jgi:excisionase family DNA binding protein
MSGQSSGLLLPGWLSTSAAADLLSVTRHQVVELVRSGQLRAARPSARLLLVEAESAHRLAQLRRGSGRPWAAHMAWGALWALSGLACDWLKPWQRSRLRARLPRLTPPELVWLARRRAERAEAFRVAPSLTGRARSLLALTGASAPGLGLVGQSAVLDGYAPAEAEAEFVRQCHAVRGPGANVAVRLVAEPPFPLSDHAVMPEAVVAADLCESLDARERDAGLSTLKGLLDARR